jgi:hypothetical protein
VTRVNTLLVLLILILDGTYCQNALYNSIDFSYLIQYLIHPAFCFLQATPPPSTIQMISEHNKVPPKLTGKRNYVSIEAMKSEAAQKIKTKKLNL